MMDYLIPVLLPAAFLFDKSRRDPLLDKLKNRGGRVRCPRCGWEPQAHDRWLCVPDCGHIWNTFETFGRCPSCLRQWEQTACLKCGQWSRHEDWYESEEK